MKRALVFTSGILTIVVGVFALAYLTSAATTKFSFTGRGVAQEHDFTGKNMRVFFTQLSERARSLGLGVSLDVQVSKAKFYKRDSAGKLVRVNQGNIGIGDEVSIRGVVKSDDRFVATQVIVINTGFTMKGKLRTYDAVNRRMTVDVTSSTFRSSSYVGKIVSFIFPPNAKVFSGGREKQLDEVTANDQKVQVEGKLVNNSELEVTRITENVR